MASSREKRSRTKFSTVASHGAADFEVTNSKFGFLRSASRLMSSAGSMTWSWVSGWALRRASEKRPSPSPTLRTRFGSALMKAVRQRWRASR